MIGHWSEMRLREVLTRVKSAVAVEDDMEYVRLTIRMNGNGIVQRDRVGGYRIGTKKQFIARAGQLVLSKIDARNGAFGILPKECDNAIITGNFWAFDVDKSRLLPRFFELLTKTALFVEFCINASEGTTNRLYLQENKFLGQTIALPALAEQLRIVERIEDVAARIQEASSLRDQAVKEIETLLRSVITHDKNVKPTPMRQLVTLRSPDVVVRKDETYQFAGVYSFGRGVFKGTRKSGSEFAYARLTRLRTGDFVYPKLMAWEGAFGVVPPSCDGCVVSPEFPVFEVLDDRVVPEVLDVHFRTPSVWPQIARTSTGTNVRRRRLNPKDFLDYSLPLPSRETQIVVRRVKAELDKLSRPYVETAAELDALLPAILDRALKGEPV